MLCCCASDAEREKERENCGCGSQARILEQMEGFTEAQIGVRWGAVSERVCLFLCSFRSVHRASILGLLTGLSTWPPPSLPPSSTSSSTTSPPHSDLSSLGHLTASYHIQQELDSTAPRGFVKQLCLDFGGAAPARTPLSLLPVRITVVSVSILACAFDRT